MKKTLTKKQRLMAYKKAIKMIEGNNIFLGAFFFCHDLGECSINRSFKSQQEMLKFFPELNKYKPSKEEYIWFPNCKNGNKKRLSVMKGIVNRLEKELKPKKK